MVVALSTLHTIEHFFSTLTSLATDVSPLLGVLLNELTLTEFIRIEQIGRAHSRSQNQWRTIDSQLRFVKSPASSPYLSNIVDNAPLEKPTKY